MSIAIAPAWPHLVIRASAGTGKTFQLSNRFLSLLAAGVPAEEILATTFTRKAAGEILDRVLFRLAEAAQNAKLLRELGGFIGRPDLTREECLELLTQCTRQLHRLRVSTLDAFFINIASTFSLELGLPPGWQINETLADSQLRKEAIRAALNRDSTAELLSLMHLLNKGESARSVSEMVGDTVNSLYGLYLDSEQAAWQRLPRTKALAPEELDRVLNEIAAYDAAGDKRLQTAKQGDVELAREARWSEMIGKGITKCVLNDATFYKKEIPHDLAKLYRHLFDHLRAELIGPIVSQTEATYRLLDKFHTEYRRLKERDRALLFGDVTLALARSAQLADVRELAFRLDGGLRHLLLDEFQDTSLSQWDVLRPFARQAVSAEPVGSLFTVGDVKQAIYGWRGGVAEIFDALQTEFTELKEEGLNRSFRSSPPVIETVNRVFGNLLAHDNLDHYQSVVASWQSAFPEHSTFRTELPGYVCLRTTPLLDEEDDTDSATAHAAFVAQYIQSLLAESPGFQIGVLVRRNETVRRLIFALRELSIPASEEGGNPLTDSAAVQVMLAILRVADHPGDTVARFHLANSPLGKHLEFTDHTNDMAALGLSQALRRTLMDDGYGVTIRRFAEVLAESCTRRELKRLEQLVELAYQYDDQSTLRADDFAAFVTETKVDDPATAIVRVMTVHQAKGLQFDIVVLPELDSNLGGQPDRCAAGRPSPTQPIDVVCRWVNEGLRPLLPARFQQVFAEARQQDVTEALCVLYVALTRAVYAMHLLIDGKKAASKSLPKTAAGFLRATLTNKQPLLENAVAFTCGDREWFRQASHANSTLAASARETPAMPTTIVLAKQTAPRQRGLERIAPSSLEITDAALGTPSPLERDRDEALLYGTLMHAWFEQVRWLEEGVPSESELRRIAEVEVGWRGKLESLLDRFQRAIATSPLQELLSREQAYRDVSTLGLHLQHAGSLATEVRNEQPIVAPWPGGLLQGTIDRLVLLRDQGVLVGADIIDYKTDALPHGDAASLDARVAMYRPQLEAYRGAIASMLRLEVRAIATRLVFLSTGDVVLL